MKNDKVVVRPARITDTHSIMEVAMLARRNAYEAIIPHDNRVKFQEALSLNAANIKNWQLKISKSLSKPNIYVAKVLLVNGKVIGFYYAKNFEDTVHIRNLYIHPLYQGRGHGALLLSGGLRLVAAKTARLHVLSGNTAAIAFYKKFGFTIEASASKGFYGAKRLLMVRPGR